MISLTALITIALAAHIIPEEVTFFENENEICVVKVYEMGRQECVAKSYESSYSSDAWKPVIYLYPEREQETKVTLDYEGKLTATYPAYDDGWQVTAYPDGKLINSKDKQEYSYLFWEGKDNENRNYDMEKGFVVRGKDMASFLQEKLSRLGLTPKEYNEFIVYWMPQMKDNEYNLIHFATKEEYADHARLSIEPEPDSVLRVFMVYRALDGWQEVEPQEIWPFERKGFAVVEWGGTEVKQ